MSRVGMVIGLVIAFVGWILYRFFIKKDLNKNLHSLYLGFFFIGIWVLFYFFIVDFF
jgi:CRISPR/Cas system endoribonuclease Cas6 (RAMP superfamily)